jgi:hypothetical protein
MKRFTNDGTNDQQGRELIPAHRNAEEEEALCLSFEGVAGARTFSRRQAVGLLGGSLAGASLRSLGLAAPARSRTFPFKEGDKISLDCVGGPQDARFFLDGRTVGGTVGLAPTTQGPYTGTSWEVFVVKDITSGGPMEILLRCLGHLDGPEWLDGRTADGGVGLAPHTGGVYTGTVWQVREEYDPGWSRVIALKCLGKGVEGNRWLVGDPRDRTVRLGPQAQIKDAHWQYTFLNL